MDLLGFLQSLFGTAGGSFRNLARPEQAYFAGFKRKITDTMGQQKRLDGASVRVKRKNLQKIKNWNSVQGRKTLGKWSVLP
jgi:hypothetical protein